jgi:arginine:pyruvate transaminase
MRLGSRVAHMTGGTGDGWDIYYRARDLAAAGEKVWNLTIGDHDRRTDPRILDALHRAALAGATGYTVGSGRPALRDAIAARVAERTGVATARENVIVTPGGQGALFSAHMVLAGEGDTALYCDPYYATYPATLRATGARAVAVGTRAEAGFQPEEAALDAAARATGARTLLINTPNNPSGAVYSRATLEGIARVALAHDLWVIADEVYDTMVWEGEHVTLRALPGMAERTVVIGSMSKSHAMTGSRLGWMVAPPEVAQAVTTLATNTTYGVPGYIQEAALFALGLGEGFEADTAAPFARRRAIAVAALKGATALGLRPCAGGMFLMVDVRATGLSGDAFAGRLLEAERIAVMPGESFGASTAGHIRIAMTIPDEEFAEAVGRLAAFSGRL